MISIVKLGYVLLVPWWSFEELVLPVLVPNVRSIAVEGCIIENQVRNIG